MTKKDKNIRAKPAKVKTENSEHLFPIVGIGASAGGLEALEQFLRNVPENSGMAFVIIQHLDPTREDAMPELLQRSTTVKVVHAEDRQEIMPDTAYIIPPNKTMSMLRRRLYLFEPTEPRGLRLPIDHFFRSLAEDQQERSIAVILSGMGSDGTMGVQAIREKSGLVLVQNSDTAKFNGMPSSVIDAGLADVIAPADKMPELIISHLQHSNNIESKTSVDKKGKSALDKIIILLRSRTGHDFSMYKSSTIYRRIERRMNIHKIDQITSYVRYLQENNKELDILFKELLIGVTSFFRDPTQWEIIKKKMLPALLEGKPSGYVFRAWVVGCSTGEEAYSLAIIFKETLESGKIKGNYFLQVFATDIDSDAINKARKGVFPANIENDVSAQRLNRFFIKTENSYRINAEIREMVVFAPQNVVMHPPFTKLDILTCRNLLIYLDAEIQKKILTLFHYSLTPKGILMLGNSETIGNFTHLFTPFQPKSRIFTRNESPVQPEPIDFPTSFMHVATNGQTNIKHKKSSENLQTLADQYLLQQFSPASVLVNSKGDILYINGRTGKYLEPAAGKANWNIHAMARDGLRTELNTAFLKAIRQKNTVTLHNIKVGTNGGSQNVEVIIHWIENPEALKGTLLIVFKDVPAFNETKMALRKRKNTPYNVRITELELEVQRAREEQQATLEEMQTSQEELTSSNEELQSTNEELQSTNEELTTSKEEMQSLNEELQTVNAELQSKVDELSRANNDMKNLLNSTDVATLFLDSELNIRRFTIQASKIIKLIASDVGRPVTDLATELDYPDLSGDVKEVLRSLITSEKAIATKSGVWYNVRIMPYRTIESQIEGVVITFTDITKAKQLETSLTENEKLLQILIKNTSGILIGISLEQKIIKFNPAAENFFGKKSEEVMGRNFVEQFIPASLQKTVEKELNRLMADNLQDKFSSRVLTKKGDIVNVTWSACEFFDDSGHLSGIFVIG